jgi:hypothetical protein
VAGIYYPQGRSFCNGINRRGPRLVGTSIVREKTTLGW